ncbi:hypothetical protein GCM10011583_24230 [Streptomyces camponoticapitis]|uniref:Ester cyclase n=1 Tax=Streptomyces camponoticapitis TaxID=1616125 RepID=A0ABQ2E3T7_9ACTN|nr:ester cyclase [Streptomyces camponoticapitis]GGJ91896.1 hypothetical protein GCM10011583_24230 [Streptomyces camponoticapitis]
MSDTEESRAAIAVVRRCIEEVEPTGRKMRFEAIDAMRVVDGRIIAHWGVGNLYSLASQLGGIPESGQSI